MALPTGAYQGQDLANWQAGNKFLPREYYSLKPYTVPTTEEEQVTETFGIPYTNAFTGGGGGGGGGTGNTFDLIGDFNKAVTDREARINEANRPMRPANEGYRQPGRGVFTPAEQPSFKRSVQDFIYDKVPYINRPQSYKDIMTKGYQEPTGPGLPTLFNFLNKMGVQNFSSLPQSSQAFIKSQSGYRGPTVFGENTSGLNVDPFGLNVESMFGNYDKAVSEDHTKLSDMLSGKLAEKYGVEWDEETGQYIGANAAKANKMTKALRSRWGFRKNQINKQTAIKDDLTDIGKFKQKAAQQHQAQQQQMEQDRQGGQNPSAQTFRDAPGGLSQAQSRAARGDPKGTGGGWKWAEGGRVGFKYGGLAGIL